MNCLIPVCNMNNIPLQLFLVVTILSGLSPSARADDLAVKETKDLITISADNKPIVEYRQTCNPNKVYVSKLFTPAGIQVLLDSPHDHIHHHALMYALDAGEHVWWMDGAAMGKQVPAGKAETKQHRQSVVIQQAVNWNSAAGATILKEARSITLHQGENIPSTLLTWNTTLSTAGKDPIELKTSRHYAGLGIRFVREMDKIGAFIIPGEAKSTHVRGTENVTAAPWCAYQTARGDKPVTVAMFSAPGNFRHPTYWFTMTEPFAYISATLNLYRQAHTLRSGNPLDLTYGVAVFDGKPNQNSIEKLYRIWLTCLPAEE